MSDGTYEVASGQVAGTEWDGRTFAAIAVRIEAKTLEEARARLAAFYAEASELAGGHEGVALTVDIEEIYPTFKRACEVLEKLIADTVRQIARDQ